MAGLDLPTLVQKVRLDADTKGAEDQTKGALSRIGGTMTKVGVGLTAAVTVPIIGMAVTSVSAASDLAESASKVGVVFEDNADKVRAFASTAATELGISEQAALEAAGTFGNLFRALGVGTGPAAEMSTSLVTLAADLASFNNANPEDVLLALRSGLLGEAEPLRQFGVSLSAARIEAEALASGIVKPVANATKLTEAALKVEDANAKAAAALKEHGKGSLEYEKAALAATKAEEAYAAAAEGTVPELTAAQKAQAAYAIIQQDTALAQGDFARTSDGLANQQRILAAQFQDVKAVLGKALLPIVSKAAGQFIRLLSTFKNLSPEGRKMVFIVAGIAGAAGPLLIVTGKLFKAFDSIRSVLSVGSGLLGLGPLLPIVALVAGAGLLLYENWSTVEPIFRDIIEAVEDFVRRASPAIKGWVDDVLANLKKWWDDNGPIIVDAVELLRDGVKEAFGLLIEAGGFVIDHWDQFKILAAGMATVIGAHYVSLGVEATASAATQAVAWGSMKVAALASKAETAAIIVLMIADWVKLAGKAVIHAATVAGAWLVTELAALRADAVMVQAAIIQGGAWAGLAVSAETSAARIAKAWLAALGPAAAVIIAAEEINNLLGNKLNPADKSLLERLDPRHALEGITFDLPGFALGGRPTPGQPFFAGENGVELVTGESGSAQVLSADRTERLLRQIAGGAGVRSSGGDTYPISVQTVDRPSGERLGRDIAWGIASSTGRPLAGAGRPS